MEFYIGNFEAVHKHIEAGLPLYDKEAHRDHRLLYVGHDPESCGYVFDALVLQASANRPAHSRSLTRDLRLPERRRTRRA